MLSTVIASKLAVAACAGAVTLGGTAAAAFTGSLPAPLQGFAHHTIGAPSDEGGTDGGLSADATPSPTAEASPAAEPSPSAEPSPTASPSTAAVGQGVGPDVTAHAAKGLCNAYLHGGLGLKSIPLRNLTQAAGAEDAVAAYCAAVLLGTPAPTASPTASPSGETSLDADAQATVKGNGHGNGKAHGHVSNGHGNPHN